MSKNYEEWLKYYENATKEQIIEDVEHDNLEIERLNNIINELEKDIQKEIDRTNDLILEDGGLGEITTIRKMLNETRQCILFRIKQLKGDNNEKH